MRIPGSTPCSCAPGERSQADCDTPRGGGAPAGRTRCRTPPLEPRGPPPSRVSTGKGQSAETRRGPWRGLASSRGSSTDGRTVQVCAWQGARAVCPHDSLPAPDAVPLRAEAEWGRDPGCCARVPFALPTRHCPRRGRPGTTRDTAGCPTARIRAGSRTGRGGTRSGAGNGHGGGGGPAPRHPLHRPLCRRPRRAGRLRPGPTHPRRS